MGCSDEGNWFQRELEILAAKGMLSFGKNEIMQRCVGGALPSSWKEQSSRLLAWESLLSAIRERDKSTAHRLVVREKNGR